MKICMITKYPPIEGGVSSKAYWTAKALGELGHEVHVVTNALEVENEYREQFDLSDPNYQPKNVFVHSTDPAPTIEANPSHIPFSKMYCEKLASLAIEVIEDYNIDLIDSRYLVPYCVAGYIAKTVTEIPQVISHAGSDLQRLYSSPYLKILLEKTLIQADRIITNPEATAFFSALHIPTSKISELPQVYIDTTAFNPKVEPYDLKQHITTQKYTTETPVIAYIGKITYHFETKGLPKLLEACSKINKDFLLLFVAQGNKIEEFKTLINLSGLASKILFIPFLPPWQMPSLLKTCTCVVSLENDTSPVLSYHTPTIAAETIATGRTVLISKSISRKLPYAMFKRSEELLIVDNMQIDEIKQTLNIAIDNANTKFSSNFKANLGKLNSEYFHTLITIYRSIVAQQY